MAEIVVDSQVWKFVQTQIVDWWSEDDHNFPWRAPDEEWRLLVTEVLLQRTRAETVADERNVFFARFNSPASLGDASEEEVAEAIYSLGLAWRAKYLRELGAALAKTDGVVPDSTDEIRELPGVGPYVAGAFQALHRNKHASFVDANVVRLLARFFGFEKDGETRRKRWFLKLVEQLFDHDYEPRTFGYALLDFTREICARKAHCSKCPLREQCTFGQNSMSE
ncbi:hypothetical protein [Lujinxingia vulgaris]|uniref:hypothetical protein n=1 Tax=Lujinxingia vulgaris TaxID=2600176 RepID=UPI001E4A03E5|nr:hypothetical protein [Lujinxingia vulgaris]